MNLRQKKTKVLLIAVVFCSVAGAAVYTHYLAKESPSAYQEITSLPAVPALVELLKPVSEAAKIKTHQIQPGETLSTIAIQYGLDVASLQAANPEAGETLAVGEQLLILPQKGVLHTVDMGDTLWTIANTYGVEVSTILAANDKSEENLRIGEKLFVPGGKLSRAEIPVSRAGVSRFMWPVNGELSSEFGYRWGRLHAGIDIANDNGAPVQAARNGQVLFAGWYGSYGYTVMIDHGQGYVALYGHLSDYVVVPGQEVGIGQTIGYVGSTGNSTGPHLHFEVHKDGQLVNPLSLLP